MYSIRPAVERVVPQVFDRRHRSSSMRTLPAMAVGLLVVLAGCGAPLSSADGGSSQAGTAGPTTAGTPTGSTSTTSAGTSTDASTSTATTGSGTAGETTAAANTTGDLADPPSDRLGWENGLWYNESLSVDDSDGLNASERAAVVNRTMARIEVVRQLEYNGTVPVSVISRAQYQQQAGGGQTRPSFRTFDNAKFEAMFMVGEDRDSLAVQQQNRGSSVLGFYSPTNDSIVVISETTNPRLNASTLAHELTHALQDQQFDLTDDPAATRDQYNARNGLVEGEANLVQRRYEQRFNDSWESVGEAESGGEGSGGNASNDGLHYGIYFLNFFPYSDGPGFVETLYKKGGWEAVNEAYENVPASAEQVIYPELYGEDAPTNVTIEDSSSGDWERVRPEATRPGQVRPPYAVLGQSALPSMFAYTLLDIQSGSAYNRSALVQPAEVINRNGTTDPLNYDLPATQGWGGDKMYVYRNDENETGYVWSIVWDSPAEAEQFAANYEDLLSHWGGDEVSESGTTSTWTIEEASPFTDAFRVQVNGDTVTITNAPTTEDLDGVHGD
jgi:hypothetical protein